MQPTSSCLIALVAAVLGSSIWSVLLEVYKLRQNKKSSDRQMLLGLGHDRLYYILDQKLRDGYITVDELENIEYLYRPYREMGGNGTCERMYEQVNLLPHQKTNED